MPRELATDCATAWGLLPCGIEEVPMWIKEAAIMAPNVTAEARAHWRETFGDKEERIFDAPEQQPIPA